VEEAEGLEFCPGEAGYMASQCLKEVKGPDDVCPYELGRSLDGAIDVGLGGEINDRLWLALG
jgi:hypothetical protein